MASINHKDLEAISAYIDEALSPRERARLEERLRHEPELHAELNSMRRTRRILRSTPAFRAPRNFTLTPDMVEDPASKEHRWLPITRFAFSLASIFFVFTLVGNFAFGQRAGAQSQEVTAFTLPAAEDSMAIEEAAPLEAADTAEEEAAESAVSESAAEQPVERIEVESLVEAEGAEEIPVEDMAPTQTLPAVDAPSAEEGASETAPMPDISADLPSGGGGVPPEPTPVPVVEEMGIAPESMENQEVVVPEEAIEIPGEDEEQIEVEESVRDPELSTGEEDGESSMQKTESVPLETVPPESRPNVWLVAAVVSGVVAVFSGALSLVLRRS